MELGHNCSKTRKEFLATSDKPFHFVDSGLPNVYLVGIRYFECECGRVVAEIPAIKQLMKLIARIVIEKPEALSGAEIRLLRKRLGKKSLDFAKDIGIQPETLSRIENEHQTAGEGIDKFIRLYYVLASEDPLLTEVRRQLIDVLKSWKQADTPPKKLVARVTNNEWQAERAAA
jgi:transcriptional regulator with XRE-family HTH domain